MQRKPIIAIDGPAGAGKSTVTKAFAKKLGFIYLDTGAMYRAVTWLIISNSIDPSDQAEIKNILKDSKLEFKNSSFVEQKIFINNIDVTEKIRSPEVTSMVSEIAKQQFVRELLTQKQQVIGDRWRFSCRRKRHWHSCISRCRCKNFSYSLSKQKEQKEELLT